VLRCQVEAMVAGGKTETFTNLADISTGSVDGKSHIIPVRREFSATGCKAEIAHSFFDYEKSFIAASLSSLEKESGVSFRTIYGLFVAIYALVQTTVTTSKMIGPSSGADDFVSGPYNLVTNALYFLFYLAFYFIYYDELFTAPMYYFGGIGTYIAGYFTYTGYYFFAVYCKEIVTEVNMSLHIFGAGLFAVGSLILLKNSVSPFRSDDFTPVLSKPLTGIIFGPPCTWHGCNAFLLGSLAFLSGGLMDISEIEGSMMWYQLGIVLYLIGRIFFLVSGLKALYSHEEFRYGGNNHHCEKIKGTLNMGMQLYRLLRDSRHDDDENGTCFGDDIDGSAFSVMGKRLSNVKLPSGSWVRKAKLVHGRPGYVTVGENGDHVLHAILRKNDGSFMRSSTPFLKNDSFTAIDGQFMEGFSAGSCFLSRKAIIDLCGMFEELDVEGCGYICAQDLGSFLEQMGHDPLSQDALEAIVRDLNLKEDSDYGNCGLSFPEFLLLMTSNNIRIGEAQRDQLWNRMDLDGNGSIDVDEFLDFVRGLKMFSVDRKAVKEFMSRYASNTDEMGKQEFYALISDDARQVSQVQQAGRKRASPRNNKRTSRVQPYSKM